LLLQSARNAFSARVHGTQRLIWSVPTRTMDSGRAETGSNPTWRERRAGWESWWVPLVSRGHPPFRPAGLCWWWVVCRCGWADGPRGCVLTLSTSTTWTLAARAAEEGRRDAGCRLQVLKQEQSAKWPASRSGSLLHVGLSVNLLPSFCRVVVAFSGR
jgi:hypothetical protein